MRTIEKIKMFLDARTHMRRYVEEIVTTPGSRLPLRDFESFAHGGPLPRHRAYEDVFHVACDDARVPREERDELYEKWFALPLEPTPYCGR